MIEEAPGKHEVAMASIGNLKAEARVGLATAAATEPTELAHVGKRRVIQLEDRSANKSRTMISSLEVLSVLSEEYQDNMIFKDGDLKPSAFYESFVPDKRHARITTENAPNEFGCIWREHAQLLCPKPRTFISDELHVPVVANSKIPTRYFILKSLTQYDLDLSVEKGVWATQRHNECILDQAYRTSKEVYLIFRVNKTGEFYGYAKMAGPIVQKAQRVSWASRTDSPPVVRRNSSTALEQGTFPSSPHEDRYDELPLPISSETLLKDLAPPRMSGIHKRDITSALAEIMSHPHRALSQGIETLQTTSIDLHTLRFVPTIIAGQKPLSQLEDSLHGIRYHPCAIEVTEESPLHTVTSEENERPPSSDAHGKGKGVVCPSAVGAGEARREQAQGPRVGQGARMEEDGPVWPESFKIEWVRTERLAFTRTRHLRNPWNHTREVKVSRDGTELEPTVGQALLDEWDRLAVGGAGRAASLVEP